MTGPNPGVILHARQYLAARLGDMGSEQGPTFPRWSVSDMGAVRYLLERLDWLDLLIEQPPPAQPAMRYLHRCTDWPGACPHGAPQTQALAGLLADMCGDAIGDELITSPDCDELHADVERRRVAIVDAIRTTIQPLLEGE